MRIVIDPPGWKRPKGYSNAIVAEGRMVFIAGQIGWDAQERLVSADFVEQAAQALRNVVALLAAAGAKPEHIVRMTWYLADADIYLRDRARLGAAYRDIIGQIYPVMTAVEVSRLIESGALVEVEATAVIPR